MRTVGETVHIRNIETLVQSKKGKLMSVNYTQRRRDGEQQQRKREIYDSGNSAVVLPYDPARKKVLLTRQLRLPVFLQDGEKNVLEACAGKLDGATAEERIRKEIEEELGYRIVEVERLFELYVSPASIMEKKFPRPSRRSFPWHEPLAAGQAKTTVSRVAPNRRVSGLAEWLSPPPQAPCVEQLHVRVP